MKYIKLFEEFETIKLSDYAENFGYNNLYLLSSGSFKMFIPKIVKYVENELGLTTYAISKNGISFNNVFYFLFVDKEGDSVDITLITNDKKKTININMINSSTLGKGLGKKVVESIKNYAITNEYKILVANVTNYIFWNKLGFKQIADDKMFVSFN